MSICGIVLIVTEHIIYKILLLLFVCPYITRDNTYESKKQAGGQAWSSTKKLQQLRIGKNLTQQQLAEQLYVSRTAISKWESGKGYPNIESLKCISKFFSVTIDELLSGEELITLAETENRSNLEKNLQFHLWNIRYDGGYFYTFAVVW